MKIKRACLVFLFPKILILRFHMWSLDLLPVTGGICCKRLQAAEPTTQRGERGASRRRGRASPLKQPLAGVRRTRRRWTRLPGAPQPLPLASTRSYAVMSRRRRAHKSLTDPFTVITFKAQKKKKKKIFSKKITTNRQNGCDFWQSCQASGFKCAPAPLKKRTWTLIITR